MQGHPAECVERYSVSIGNKFQVIPTAETFYLDYSEQSLGKFETRRSFRTTLPSAY